MSNIVPFPSAGAAAERPSGRDISNHLGARLLSEPPSHAHAVQFYDDARFLFETVGFFLSAGLAAGEAGLLIATPEHTRGVLGQMHTDVCERAIASGQLLLVDADAMLARFMHGEEAVESAFEAALTRLLEGSLSGKWPSEAGAPGFSGRVRVFTEIVGLLWKRGNPAAALQVERFWNRAITRHDLALLCGCGMRSFYKADDATAFSEVCELHTHVMPTEQFARAGGDVFARLRDISLLQQRARSLDSEVAYRGELEAALRATIEERTTRTRPARGDAPSPRAAPVRAVLTASRLLRATLGRVVRR